LLPKKRLEPIDERVTHDVSSNNTPAEAKKDRRKRFLSKKRGGCGFETSNDYPTDCLAKRPLQIQEISQIAGTTRQATNDWRRNRGRKNPFKMVHRHTRTHNRRKWKKLRIQFPYFSTPGPFRREDEVVFANCVFIRFHVG